MQFLNPTYIIAILIAISVHEWAHAFTADRLGDPTPRDFGRLTINPIAHIDLLGALMFLVVGFGWAKPVPVNPAYFRRHKAGMALTAIAGPLSNLILAFAAYALMSLIAIHNPGSVSDLLNGTPTSSPILSIFLMILQGSLFVNLALMAFNLFPIAPLDGSKVLQLFIPLQYEDQYEDFLRIGPFILIGLLLFESFLPFPLLSSWIRWIMEAVFNGFSMVF